MSRCNFANLKKAIAAALSSSLTSLLNKTGEGSEMFTRHLTMRTPGCVCERERERAREGCCKMSKQAKIDFDRMFILGSETETECVLENDSERENKCEREIERER